MLKRLRNLLLTGILVILPLIGSLYIFYYIFLLLDNLTIPLVNLVLGKEIRGIGFALDIIIILLVGLFATNIIGKQIILMGEDFLLKIPLFKNIYISIKRLIEGMFVGNKQGFKKAVIFEYPRKGIYQIGFVTRNTPERINNITGKKTYNIFLPTTPNPTSGMFVMVPCEDVKELDMHVEDVVKLIISGGILVPGELKVREINDEIEE